MAGAGMASRVLVAGAALWSALLVVAALTLPVYSGEESTSQPDGSMVTRATSDTLVDVNGLWGAVIAAVPLVATVLVAVLVGLRQHRSARVAAWATVGALGLLTVAGLLSVGLFFAPVVVALALGVATAPPAPTPGPRPWTMDQSRPLEP